MQGVLDSQGKRMTDLSVVRIGQPCRDEYQRQGIETFGKSRGGPNALSANEENMVRIVERATLETLVEERRRALAASDTRQHGATLKVADIRKQVLDQADVVCSTLSGAGSQPMLEVVLRMTGFKFDAVIIDEAAQAVEPSSLIPFKYNPQAVVLVGDPCQLPATVFSRTAKHANYHQSLFQRLQAAGYPVLMLEIQYRMHPLIADYPSQRFYQGRLVTGSQLLTSDTHTKPYHNDPSGRFRPFVFHNVSYSQESTEGTSICNREEAQYVVDLFEELVRKYPDHRGGIGIIAPYRAQRRLLNNLFRERFGNNSKGSTGGLNRGTMPQIFDLDTEISTVDGFQGREKSIVIFSCVRAPTSRTARFYKSQHPSEADLVPLSEQNLSTAAATSRAGTTSGVIVPSRSMSELSSAGLSEAAASTETDTPHRSIGFLKEWQRLNVAITRSRYALWMVGHGDVLKEDGEWRHLIEYSQNRGSYYTAPEPTRGSEPRNGPANNVPRNSAQQSRPPQQAQPGGSNGNNKKKWKNKNRNKHCEKNVSEQRGDPRGDDVRAPEATGKRPNDKHQPNSFAGDKRQKVASAPPPATPATQSMPSGSVVTAPTLPAASPFVSVSRPVTSVPIPRPGALGPFSSSSSRPPLPPSTSVRMSTGGSLRGPFSAPVVAIKQEPQWSSGRPPLPPGQPRTNN
jgi:hypothetical protein